MLADKFPAKMQQNVSNEAGACLFLHSQLHHFTKLNYTYFDFVIYAGILCLRILMVIKLIGIYMGKKRIERYILN